MTDDEIIQSMQREIARLSDDVARLRAGLDLLGQQSCMIPYTRQLVATMLAGADPRNPEQRKAIALGQWKPGGITNERP